MDFLLKTKIRGVTKLVKCNGADTNVYEFIAKGMRKIVRQLKYDKK